MPFVIGSVTSTTIRGTENNGTRLLDGQGRRKGILFSEMSFWDSSPEAVGVVRQPSSVNRKSKISRYCVELMVLPRFRSL
jgi:hypothetical protein